MQTQPSIHTVSSKGQVVIPANVREDLKIRDGDKVMFVKSGGKYMLEKVLSRQEKRAAWLAEAFAAYANDKSEKVWEAIDGEAFSD